MDELTDVWVLSESSRNYLLPDPKNINSDILNVGSTQKQKNLKGMLMDGFVYTGSVVYDKKEKAKIVKTEEH